MSRFKKRPCLVCKWRRARIIQADFNTSKTQVSGYSHSPQEPVFCSIKCAAAFGLLHFGTSTETEIWCDEHGWGGNGMDGCSECNSNGGDKS